MCLDFHPQHSSLLVVGLYDGSVLVYDIRNKVNRPIRQCDVKTGKHTDPVWQVKWQEQDLSEKNLSFYSVSSDGRVTLWTMSKSELAYQDVMELKLVTNPDEENADDDATLGTLAGGCCFDFNKQSDHLFVVGTEEGNVHKCSTAYNSQYLETYQGHHMAVYTARWNTHHPRSVHHRVGGLDGEALGTRRGETGVEFRSEQRGGRRGVVAQQPYDVRGGDERWQGARV